jgi:hypothetical protein
MFRRIRTGLLLAIAFPIALRAQTITAFKSGEETTGMTKQCYYKFGTSKYSKTVQSVELCPLSIDVDVTGASPKTTSPGLPALPELPKLPAAPKSAGVTAFKTGEETTGMTKQCYYAFGASKYTKTVQSVELCPLSIEVP